MRPPRPPSHLPPPPTISSSGGLGSNNSGCEEDPPAPSPGVALGFSKSTFTYEELATATDDFSDANLLGQGGFGYVHRGALADGKEVAIKQLKAGSGQGEREFQAEVEIISRVHHKHLVSLVGYCIAGCKRLLVYEFVPNNTLGFHLHGQPTMEWPTRLRIALGSAKGLAYLHEDYFGLAKFASDTDTHISTRVMGTFGYASSSRLISICFIISDSLLKIRDFTSCARPRLARAVDDGNYDALVDPRLGKKYDLNEMARMVACAAACVRHSARRRPRMSQLFLMLESVTDQIARALEGDTRLEDSNEGIRPGYNMYHTSCGSSDYDSGQYGEDIGEFRKMVMGDEEYATGESIVPTAEYAQNPSTSSSGEGRHTQGIEMGKKRDASEKGG
ncbi:hypothetical protein BHM03_00006681 [Ensete ventricosum]|nr:hypothetical protein BHM03_00006681 [Ensete ventricosum]